MILSAGDFGGVDLGILVHTVVDEGEAKTVSTDAEGNVVPGTPNGVPCARVANRGRVYLYRLSDGIFVGEVAA